jgi:organic hydroperoxide reductase OsmC/OhrA
MTETVVELRTVAGTEAALGWAGAHTLVVDRAEGVAGGGVLGFNGGQLLALAIGGCLCNDPRYVGHAMGVTADCRTADGAPADAGGEQALANSTGATSMRSGFPVDVRRA